MQPRNVRRRTAAVVAGLALALGAGAVWLGKRGASGGSAGAEIFGRPPGLPGPWGQLEYTAFAIEPPLEIDAADLPRWFFAGQARPDVLKLLAEAGLPPGEITRWTDGAEWREEADGIWVVPAPELVYSLRAHERRHLYDALARSPKNRDQREPILLAPDELEARLATAGLDQPTIARLQRLIYPRRRWLALADGPLLAASLPPGQRHRLWTALLSHSTFSVTVAAGEHDSLDEVVSYWGAEPSARDARRALRERAAAKRGARIDLAEILPPFARQRLYRYPAAAEATKDCFWTALNFFNTTPDERFASPDQVLATLEADFRPVSGDPRFGDLVVMVDSRGVPVHAAIYLADGVVFTKNGAGSLQPWMLMRLETMHDYYQAMWANRDTLRSLFARRIDAPLQM